jgi:AcrR family transcriptional regulator
MPAPDASPLPGPASGPSRTRRPRSSTAERSALLRRDLMEGELYDKAAQLFAEKGFAGTTLQDIANAMGVSRPSLYHYISSKDELLERLAEDVTAAAVAIVSEIASDESLTAPDKMHRTVHRMVEFIASKPSRFRLLNQSESAMPEQLAATQSRLGRQILKRVIAIIDEGQRTGVFRPVDPRVAALGIIGTWNWVAWWHGGGDIGASAEQLADAAVRGLLAQPTESRDTSPAALFALIREDLGRLEAVVGPQGAPTPEEIVMPDAATHSTD